MTAKFYTPTLSASIALQNQLTDDISILMNLEAVAEHVLYSDSTMASGSVTHKRYSVSPSLGFRVDL